MSRVATLLLLPALCLSGAACSTAQPADPASGGFEFAETTVAELQEAMHSGRLTSRALTAAYLARIDALDRRGPELRAVLEINPEALAIADSLDAERRAGRVRGPLHGIPVLVKDNIDTGDRMTTTAGSLALEGLRAGRDAFIVERLRDAGAVLLGKANLSEWANFRSTRSASGWSSRGGQVRNPYALDRSPCGSSSGSAVAVAANLVTVAVGTETDGSVVCPAATNGIVGIKPTMGLVSRTGIIPIAHSQDIAGAMARTVADAALLLGVLAGADPRDPSTAKIRVLGRQAGARRTRPRREGHRQRVPRCRLRGHLHRAAPDARDDRERRGAGGRRRRRALDPVRRAHDAVPAHPRAAEGRGHGPRAGDRRRHHAGRGHRGARGAGRAPLFGPGTPTTRPSTSCASTSRKREPARRQRHVSA
jgi:Asp-tRNA(Asn)/Glu-tRNA(Gln) amidotransferase A subunit family amidase